MEQVIHINLVVNEKFMPGANVAAASVCVYARQETKLVFHLFTENVDEKSVCLFTSVVKRIHPRSEVVEYKCTDETLQGLPYWAGSRMSALRCSYAKLLPDVDICVHLDADVLFLASIEEYVGFLNDDQFGVASLEQDKPTAYRECAWIKKATGVDVDPSNYFLAGMMVMNLKKIRDEGVADKFKTFFAEHPDVKSPDQDALNTYFVGKVGLVPAKWNLLQTSLTDDLLKQMPVIHYVCGIPWLPRLGAVANGRFWLWHAFADKYVWQKKGESCRRSFPRRVLWAKVLLNYLLRTPIIGLGFASVLALMGRVVNARGWIHVQTGNDVTKQGIERIVV